MWQCWRSQIMASFTEESVPGQWTQATCMFSLRYNDFSISGNNKLHGSVQSGLSFPQLRVLQNARWDSPFCNKAVLVCRNVQIIPRCYLSSLWPGFKSLFKGVFWDCCTVDYDCIYFLQIMKKKNVVLYWLWTWTVEEWPAVKSILRNFKWHNVIMITRFCNTPNNIGLGKNKLNLTHGFKLSLESQSILTLMTFKIIHSWKNDKIYLINVDRFPF